MEKCPCCGNAEQLTTTAYDKNPGEEQWSYNCFADKTLSSCPTCGSFFTREALKEEELNQFYNSLYSEIDSGSVKINRLHEFNPRYFSQVLYLNSHVDLFDGIRILEIGPNQVSALPSYSLFCQPVFCYFEQYEFPIIQHFGGKKLGEYFSKRYIENQNNADKFDVIHMSHSLEHINPSSLSDVISSIHTALKDKGALFIEVPDQLAGVKPPPHTLFFSLKGLTVLLEKAGFKITGLQTVASPISQQAAQHINNGQIKKRTLLSLLTKCAIGVGNRIPLLMRCCRPLFQRLALVDQMQALRVPYSEISYLRIVAKKIS